jgi:hypothetical protein
MGLVPPAAAVAAAVHAFDGRWRTTLPMKDTAAAKAAHPKAVARRGAARQDRPAPE